MTKKISSISDPAAISDKELKKKLLKDFKFTIARVILTISNILHAVRSVS